MLVDYEKVVLELKAEVAAKGSHGRDGLLAAIARLEAEHQIDEGLYEKALRIYGAFVTDALLRPALGPPLQGGPDGLDDGSERRSGLPTSDEGADDGGRYAGAGAAAGRDS